MAQQKRLRVISWATGNIGLRGLQAIIAHPRLDLVGLYVYSEAKEGQDAGQISGLGREVGVRATRDADEIVALDADVVAYFPAATDIGHVCRLLASGKNVVASTLEFLHPSVLGPESRRRVEEACAEGGTSVHSSGSSPGFITEAIPVPLLAQQRRLDCLTIDEFADLSRRREGALLFQVMGFGSLPERFPAHMLEHTKAHFAGSFAVLAEGLGIRLDDVTVAGVLGIASSTKTIAAGVIPAGTVGALRVEVTAMYEGRAIFRFRSNWFCSTDVEDKQDWPGLEDDVSGWLVRVEGDAPMEMRVTFPVAVEDFEDFAPGLTANRIINAIPVVCEAAPGIRTTLDLPQILPIF